MIIRPDYIEAIKPFIDAPLVKILAGVRRCGKSTILEMMTEELKKRGISSDNIIERRYSEMDFDESFTAKDMYNDLKKAIQGKGRCYLFLDELQEIDGWEKRNQQNKACTLPFRYDARLNFFRKIILP